MNTRNHAAARVLKWRNALVLLYFVYMYMEGDSLTFPHPCVQHDRVLFSYVNNYKQGASQTKNGAIFVSC